MCSPHSLLNSDWIPTSREGQSGNASPPSQPADFTVLLPLSLVLFCHQTYHRSSGYCRRTLKKSRCIPHIQRWNHNMEMTFIVDFLPAARGMITNQKNANVSRQFGGRHRDDFITNGHQGNQESPIAAASIIQPTYQICKWALCHTRIYSD